MDEWKAVLFARQHLDLDGVFEIGAGSCTSAKCGDAFAVKESDGDSSDGERGGLVADIDRTMAQYLLEGGSLKAEDALFGAFDQVNVRRG